MKLQYAAEGRDDDKLGSIDYNFFHQIINSLIYQMIGMRPNLAVVISIISQFMSNLTQSHHKAVKCILHYLKETKGDQHCL